MSRIVGILLGLLVLVSLARAQSFLVGQFQETVSATQTNSTVDLTTRQEVLVINDGPNTVHINFIGATATTSHFPLASGEQISISHRVGPELGFICATAETASVRVLGLTYQLR